MKFNIKSRKGFTLIELLVVIGILAVLAAIAIPSVAGLIDRANVSADKTNANEYTNTIERFASEYELYCQDIASGVLKDADNNGTPDNMDSAQGRIFNVTGAITRADITALESTGLDGKQIDRDTKYPTNAKTLEAVIQNYTKTSSSTFEPKQSDMHFWYSPDCGVVVFADASANSTPENIVSKLNSQIISGKDAKGNDLSSTTNWIDLTVSSNTPIILSTITPITWENWKDIIALNNGYVWTDGTNTYYSRESYQYIFDGKNWNKMQWNGLTRFDAYGIWTDGNNIYCTKGYSTLSHYILNGDTWEKTEFNTENISDFTPSKIWSYNGNIYYTDNSAGNYVLKGNIWEPMNWKGFAPEYRDRIWSDGTNLYYNCPSYRNKQYILEGDTWVRKDWNVWVDGDNVWTDGTDFYYSNYSKQYILKDGIWVEKEWNGPTDFRGDNVWTDGTNYYVSDGGSKQYKIS